MTLDTSADGRLDHSDLPSRRGPSPQVFNVLGIEAAPYCPSPLHGPDRTWVETNCYVDLWIELLHTLGLDPRAGAAFTLAIDFEGDQFSFFKFPVEDLRDLWGIEVAEINPWLPLEQHLDNHLDRGRLLTIEVDAWYLPDTAGVSYRSDHAKTTIAVQMLDRDRQRLGYFHNSGYFELSGDDYAGALRLASDPATLTPYVEVIKLDRLVRRSPDETRRIVTRQVAVHLGRRPDRHPISAFRDRFDADLAWLVAGAGRDFHPYAFATLRQLGPAAELAASLCDWLEHSDGATGFRQVAATAKTMQFKLARAASGRAVDFDSLFDVLEATWTQAMATFDGFDAG
jgi:Domain of unknown function (DUF1839)